MVNCLPLLQGRVSAHNHVSPSGVFLRLVPFDAGATLKWESYLLFTLIPKRDLHIPLVSLNHKPGQAIWMCTWSESYPPKPKLCSRGTDQVFTVITENSLFARGWVASVGGTFPQGLHKESSHLGECLVFSGPGDPLADGELRPRASLSGEMFSAGGRGGGSGQEQGAKGGGTSPVHVPPDLLKRKNTLHYQPRLLKITHNFYIYVIYKYYVALVIISLFIYYYYYVLWKGCPQRMYGETTTLLTKY